MKFDTTTVTVRTPHADINPNTLFPIFGPDGQQLPMEQNCLKCHAGHREQLYNDRHYTAGMTCYDCHGDLLAVGKAYAKDPANPNPDPKQAHIADYRFPWVDEPDCGSCHLGNGNVGKNAVNGAGPDAAQGFFSAGVKARAFEDTDLAATPRPVDKGDPDAARFAVVPDHVYEYLDSSKNSPDKFNPLKHSAPLYRYGKDTHGGVACAACHGASHSIGPNRDPKSNENVTALQLQGYAGPILECKVCHTADAFADYNNLDAGPTSGLPADSGILGGPHNLHPVNDPTWWRKAGPGKGGWHDDVYRQPGLNGEDQCAACHGADHQGTRLSKTPIALDFTTPKGVKASWKAGEVVGCNKCHSIARSFRKGPSAPPAGNHAPVITSTPVASGVIGQAYSYQVLATDAENDPLSYKLVQNPGAMYIRDTGLVTTDWPNSLFANSQSAPSSIAYTVEVSDGQGGRATQPVTVAIACPAGQVWTWDSQAGQGSCVKSANGATITSTPPAVGLVSGDTYSYQVTATDDKGLALTYSLAGGPSGITIDAASGLITWKTHSTAVDGYDDQGKYKFRVTATDAQGGYGFQDVVFTVCPKGTTWMDSMGGMCM